MYFIFYFFLKCVLFFFFLSIFFYSVLKKNFYYIGALGSQNTHSDRCERLKNFGFNENEINSIHGPIGIKLGGKSPPEIALSIIAQLTLETYKK